jgi:hypothetical protein
VASDQIQYLAVTWGDDFGVLPERARLYQERLAKHVGEAWASADAAGQRRLMAQSGVLNRLSGFLLQVRRMIDHRDAFVASLADAIPNTTPDVVAAQPAIALAAREAITDFESLLFHGRAVLDQQTLAVARHYGQQTARFSRLQNVLSEFTAKSEEARRFGEIVAGADRLAGVLTDLEDRSLRSLVTHRGTVDGAFTMQLLADGRQLLFDAEAFGYGVLDTTKTLAAEVPFVTLNGVGIYVGLPELLSRDDCEPMWKNPTIRFDDWIDPTGSGSILRVVTRMLPNGFQLRSEHLRPEVLERATPLPSRGATCGATRPSETSRD